MITDGNASVVLHSPASLTANLLLIAGALCWVLYTIGGSYFPGWSPLRYTTLTTLLGMTSVAATDLLLMVTGIITVPDAAAITAVIPHLLYMALIAGLMAVLCWNIGNRIVTPTTGVLFMDVVPVTAFIVSALNGVVPTHVQIAGATLTATALLFNNLSQRKMAQQAVQSAVLKTSAALVNPQALSSIEGAVKTQAGTCQISLTVSISAATTGEVSFSRSHTKQSWLTVFSQAKYTAPRYLGESEQCPPA